MQVEVELCAKQRAPRNWLGAYVLDHVDAGGRKSAREFAFRLWSLDDFWAATLRLALHSLRPTARQGVLTVRCDRVQLLAAIERRDFVDRRMLESLRPWRQVLCVRQPPTERLAALAEAHLKLKVDHDSGTQLRRRG